MPERAPTACSTPGCGGLRHPGVACDRCGRGGPRPSGGWKDRPSARERGYNAAWDRRSRELRDLGMLCQYCLDEPMVALDHRIPLSEGGSTDPDTNGVPIGQRCNKRKSQAEAAAGRRRRRAAAEIG